MKTETLSDLQSLIFKVRSPQSRQNITEAIQAYYGGAYRSALMSVWVAVAFDIFEKISELALYEDPQAKQYQADISAKIEQKNVIELSKKEQDLLITACNDFEFLSKEQLIQFERLKADRNYCAHPAYTSDGLIFQPSPELVRFYIVYAVDHLLSFAPVRGKSSLEAIMVDIMGDIFPTSPDAAGKFLEEKYLKFAKAALVHNLFKLLLKGVLSDIEEWAPYKGKAIIALRGIALTKASVHDDWMKNNLVKVCDALTDKQVLRLFGLMAHDKRFWHWIGEHHRIQMKAFLDNPRLSQLDAKFDEAHPNISQLLSMINQFGRNKLSSSLGISDMPELFKMMEIDALKAPLIALFDELDDEGKIQVIGKAPSKELCDKAIGLFGSANSFRQAEKLGAAILPSIAPLLEPQQIQTVLQEVLNNGQIYSAGKMDSILSEFVTLLSKRVDIKLDAAAVWKDFLTDLIRLYDNYETLESLLHEMGLTNKKDFVRAR